MSGTYCKSYFTILGALLEGAPAAHPESGPVLEKLGGQASAGAVSPLTICVRHLEGLGYWK